MPRVLLAGLFHETHTFLSGVTGLAEFQRREGDELRTAEGDGSPLAAMLEVGRECGWEIVPVIDLRTKFGLPRIDATPNTRILVLEFLAQGRKTLIGLVADRVFEVTNLDDDRLDPAPDTGCRWRADHIAGIGRRGDKFVVVLDLERLLADDTPTLITTNLDAA